MKKKQVLLIGLEPSLVDFSAISEMNAEKVRAGLEADCAPNARICFNTKPDDTADAVQRCV